jgi:diguanylate cyclase (GGDEF)-like protein
LFTPLARLPRGLDFRDVRVDADGSIWIAGNDALFHHQPQTQSTLPSLPRPRALLVGADGNPLPPSAGTIDLGTAPGTVHAHFEEAFFDGVEQLRFRTRLEPLEKTWSEWRISHEREMTQLPDGNYRLEVQASDIFERQSDVATLAFALAPPWYLHWWAFALYALALVLLLAVMIRFRERRLRRRADELAILVSARTQQLEHASVTDALTGLRNRHYVQLLEPSWRERQRGYWLIALVDIDHFKRINDERGHAAGDEVLRAVAQRLAGVLSAADTAVRWGGEEFLIVGELEEERVAPALMQKLLCAIGDDPIAVGDNAPITVTCSIGWDVVAVKLARSLDAMLASADHKLYAAKHAGRDRAHGPQDSIIVRAQHHVVAY